MVALAVLGALGGSAAGARGVTVLDPSFGSGGVSRPPLPADAALAEAGVADLAAAPGGGSVAALGGLGRFGYFGAVRLTAAGSPDPGFGSEGFTQPSPALIPWPESTSQPQAEAVAAQPDGKVVVAGYLQEGIRNPDSFTPLLARYRADGTLDPDFGTGGVVAGPRHLGRGGIRLHAVAVAGDGRIVAVGGRSERFIRLPRPAGLVYAFKPDGSPDTSFGDNGEVIFSQRERLTYTSLRDVEILAGGKVLVLGYRGFRLFLARLNADGSLDHGFGGGDGIAVVGIRNRFCCPSAALAVQRDGRIVAAADGGPLRTSRVYLVRFLADGRLDRSFGRKGVAAPFRQWRLSSVDDVAVQGDGGILTVGRGAATRRNRHGFAYAVFRNAATGAPDRSFGNQGLRTFRFGSQSYAGAALAQPDGGVLVGGSYLTEDKNAGESSTTLLLARFSDRP